MRTAEGDLATALAALPVRQAQAVVLVDLFGLLQREVGEVFGVTDARVRQLLTAGHAALARHLSGEAARR